MFSSIFSYDKQLFVSLQSFNELVYTSYYRWQILWTVSQASRQTDRMVVEINLNSTSYPPQMFLYILLF